MADEGTSAPEDSGSEDTEAADMLADALSDEGDTGDGGGEQSDDVAKLREQLAKANKESAKRRNRIKELEPLAEEAQKLRDSQKSELEKLTEQLQAAQAEGAAATAAQLRIDVALEKAPDGMPKEQIRKLSRRLTGSSREELEEDAEELFADFIPAKGEESDEGPEKVRLPNSEKIQLDDETDPRKLAARIRRV